MSKKVGSTQGNAIRTPIFRFCESNLKHKAFAPHGTIGLVLNLLYHATQRSTNFKTERRAAFPPWINGGIRAAY